MHPANVKTISVFPAKAIKLGAAALNCASTSTSEFRGGVHVVKSHAGVNW